jgi:threonine aldolase
MRWSTTSNGSADDHRNASTIAAAVADFTQVQLFPQETNIVVFRLLEGAPDAAAVVSAARAQGVLVSAFGPRTVRATTHLDVSADDCERAAGVLAAAVTAG